MKSFSIFFFVMLYAHLFMNLLFLAMLVHYLMFSNQYVLLATVLRILQQIDDTSKNVEQG